MAHVIGLLNQKGGVGKTTLSISICHALAKKHGANKVLLVDADPQGSALAWSETRSKSLPFTIVGLPKKTLHRDLPDIAEKYKYVVIDGAPRVTELARTAIVASDLILVPCTPSPYDVWASQDIIDLIKEAQVYDEGIKYAFVINRKISGTAIGRDVVEALTGLDVQVLDHHIHQRVQFADSASVGHTVIDADPEGKAATEIMELTKEIERIVK